MQHCGDALNIGLPKPVGKIIQGVTMGIILLVLLLALIFGGLGFAVHALWIVAAVVLVAWLIGFAMRSGESARWYRW
jgi:hypothetical protein